MRGLRESGWRAGSARVSQSGRSRRRGLALADAVADLCRGHAGPVGHRPDEDDRCVGGVAPEVVVAPPDNLVQQATSTPPCRAAAARTALLNGTPNADQLVTEGSDEHEAARSSIPRIPAASAVVWEVSTWSTRSAASMNDVDTDERRRIIGLRGMAASSAREVTSSSAKDVLGNTDCSPRAARAELRGSRHDRMIGAGRAETIDPLRVEDVPVPTPAAVQVLVGVAATSVNLSDWECLRGSPAYARIGGLRFPSRRTLGSDIAGVVDAVGSGVTRFRPEMRCTATTSR